jgi:surface antigen
VMADALKAMIVSRNLTARIGNKDHVLLEGWTTLGSMLGVVAVTEWTRKVEDGWEARVEARTLDGRVVGAAESVCLRSERTWKDRDEYALKSMAQTRAASKALRMPLGFVMQLAGFDPTPAEEMPREQPVRHVTEGPKPLEPPRSWAKLTEMVSAYDVPTYSMFMDFADSARRLLFPDAPDTKSLNKADKDFLFQKCAGAAVHLREQFDPNALPYPTVDDVRACFARVLDGQELALEGES